jgi:hypothetical protein
MDRTTIGARSDHPAPESLQSIFFLQSEIATKIFDGPVNTSEMPMTISLISNKEQSLQKINSSKFDATASSRAVNRRQ